MKHTPQHTSHRRLKEYVRSGEEDGDMAGEAKEEDVGEEDRAVVRTTSG
jgi:hypothetical protein